MFVDTSALVALADRSDRNHRNAADYLNGIPRIPGGIITTDYVLDETFTLLRMTIGLKNTISFGEALMRSDLFIVVQVDAGVQKLAWEWFKQYHDKTFSFTDCTSFVVMTSLSIREAFAFDKHFAQAGFIVKP